MAIYRACGLFSLIVTLPCLVLGIALGSRDLLIPGAFGLVQCIVFALVILQERRRAEQKARAREVENVASAFGLSPSLVRRLDDLHRHDRAR